MGNTIINPVKHTSVTCTKNFLIVHSTVQGTRDSNEDDFEVNDKGFFAVYDGHDGSHVSKFLAEKLGTQIIEEAQKKKVNSESIQANSRSTGIQSNYTSSRDSTLPKKNNKSIPFGELKDDDFKHIFLQTDEELKSYMHTNEIGYQRVDNRFYGGSTAVVTMVDTSAEDTYDIVCVNSGDSRSIFIDEVGQVFPLSHDHKVTGEKERIVHAGGRVVDGRVCLSKTSSLSLGVCRGFADFTFKSNIYNKPEDQVITVVPDVIRLRRKKVVQRMTMPPTIVLGCDGLFDVMSNSDVRSFISSFLTCVNLFDNQPLRPDQYKPGTQSCFLYKRFEDWSKSDVDSFLHSTGDELLHVLKKLSITGKQLGDIATKRISKNLFMSTITKDREYQAAMQFVKLSGIRAEEVVYEQLMVYLEKELRRQKRLKKIPTTPEEKITYLAERLLDQALYEYKTNDNVSVVLVVLREPLCSIAT